MPVPLHAEGERSRFNLASANDSIRKKQEKGVNANVILSRTDPMTADFDAYHRWLGIPPKYQPADHYRLLGIDTFESDPDVIPDAAERRIGHVRRYALGQHGDLCQRILNELAGAKACLMDPVRKARYDAELQRTLPVTSATSAPAAPPTLAAPASLRLDLPPVKREAPSAPAKPAEKRMAEKKSGRLEAAFTNSLGMRLVLIPAGEFLMGSPDSDRGTGSDEKPQHTVRMTKPFYLGVTEVTQEHYERLVGQNRSHFKGDAQRPVEMVSWEDAVAFCGKLSAQENRTYRLPTEAEWEYACRAGTDEETSVPKDGFWWFETAGWRPHEVGESRPNPWKLYDMHGNVFEWCLDAWRRGACGAWGRCWRGGWSWTSGRPRRRSTR
jgi:formylglycine-generating enzyme required for sulfatase activity